MTNTSYVPGQGHGVWRTARKQHNCEAFVRVSQSAGKCSGDGTIAVGARYFERKTVGWSVRVCEACALAAQAPIDELVRKHTMSKTLDELINAAGGYFPSVRCVSARDSAERAELVAIADAYDAAQAARGDARRAYRS